MFELKFIGRGSAFNIKEGNNSAYIKKDKEFILIDCGEGIFGRIIENNLLNNIETVKVLITHLNADHVGSLSTLIFYCYYMKKITPIIYYPNTDIEELLKLMGHNKEYILQKPEVNSNFNIGSLNFSFISVSHMKVMDCYALDICDEDKRVYYSGDSNDIPKQIISELDKIDEFYQDTCIAEYEGNIHLSLRKLCELIPENCRDKVYCMHIDNNELIIKAKEQGFNIVRSVTEENCYYG